MKRMRTILALLMALVMVLSLAPTALMEGEIDHTVVVYADLYDEGEEQTLVLELGHNLTDEDLEIPGVEVTLDAENNLIDVTVPAVEVTDEGGAYVYTNAADTYASLSVVDGVEVTLTDGGWVNGISVEANDGAAAVIAGGVIVVNEDETDAWKEATALNVRAENGEAYAAIGEDGITMIEVPDAVGIYAYADGKDGSATAEVAGGMGILMIDGYATGVSASAYDEGVTKVFAEGVAIVGEGTEDAWISATGVSAYATDGGDASVAIGTDGVSVSGAQSAQGVYVYTTGEDSSVQIGSFGGVDVYGEEKRANGLQISAYDGAEATASFIGGVNVELVNPVVPEEDDEDDWWPTVQGVTVNAGEDATAELYVLGDVTATGYYGTALGVSANYDGLANVAVLGDVTSDGLGMYASAYKDGVANVTVVGDVTGDSTGLVVSSEEDGYPTVIVDGDVTGRYGLEIMGDEDAIADVIISGTLSGVYEPIGLYTGTWEYDEEEEASHLEVAYPEYVDVYVWKIDMPEEGEDLLLLNVADEAVAEEEDPLETFYQNNVHYIINREDQKGAALTLDGVYFHELGENENEDLIGFEYANESDVVTLNVALDRNYQLKGAYNAGEKLLKDADGNYYMVVERGGGVYLTLDLLRLYGTFQSSDGARLEFISTKKCKFTKGDVIEFWDYRIENGQIIITNLAGVEMVIEDVDGVWTLNYQLANGETGIMTFTNSNLARIKEF